MSTITLNQNPNLFTLQHFMLQQNVDLEDIVEFIPGSIVIHNLESHTPSNVDYMNKRGCDILGTSMEEINELDYDFYFNFFIPNEYRVIEKEVERIYANEDFDKEFSFLQKVKCHGKKEYQMYFTNSKFIKNNKGMPSKIITLSQDAGKIQSLSQEFSKILSVNPFVNQNFYKFQSLTKAEKNLIKYIAEGNSSAYIASILNISIHTINTHRKNIMKKLDLKSLAQLIRFAVLFNIID